MDGRADVVLESGQRQLLGSRAAADGLVPFEHEDAKPGASQDDGGGETVGAGADDYGVEFSHDAIVLHGAATHSTDKSVCATSALLFARLSTDTLVCAP